MKDNKYIQEMKEKLIRECPQIQKIYLTSVKVDTSGKLTSFKLGLVVDDSVESSAELANSLYMELDSELPYDLIIYQQSKFDKLKEDVGTFANKINEQGTVLYG